MSGSQTPENIDVVLTDLVETAESYVALASKIKTLQENGHFKYVSKSTRNAMLHALIQSAGEIEDASKGAFKLLKKVKRVKADESIIDALIGAPAVQAEASAQDQA